MSLLATRPDFEPATPEEAAAAWYHDPASGQGYRRYPFFQQRVDQLKRRFAASNQKVAVWGCGWGYLVEQLVAAGYDAYGFDASSYAISRGKQLLPATASRLFVRDALVAGDMAGARRDAGLTGNAKFALLVTEDLLPCMSDSEIQTALSNLRGSCSTGLQHIVTPLDPGGTQDQRFTWKTTAAWRSLLCPPDVVGDATTGLFWNANGQV